MYVVVGNSICCEMAVVLFLMTLVIAVSDAQIPNNGAELISKAKSFDIYSIKNTGPNDDPSGIPNLNLLLNNPVYTPTSDKRQKELIKDKLRSLNSDREDLSDTPNLSTNLDNNLNDNTNNSSIDIQKAVKEKIIELAKFTMGDVNSQLSVISTIHQAYKQNKFYKLGYLISYINKTREGLTHVYKHIVKNKDQWDSLKYLDAYVQMKKTKELLADMLAIVNALAGNQPPRSHLYNPTERPYDKNMIAWSYYDDTM